MHRYITNKEKIAEEESRTSRSMPDDAIAALRDHNHEVKPKQINYLNRLPKKSNTIPKTLFLLIFKNRKLHMLFYRPRSIIGMVVSIRPNTQPKKIMNRLSKLCKNSQVCIQLKIKFNKIPKLHFKNLIEMIGDDYEVVGSTSREWNAPVRGKMLGRTHDHQIFVLRPKTKSTQQKKNQGIRLSTLQRKINEKGFVAMCAKISKNKQFH